MLEPFAVKVARAVLRRGVGCEAGFLSDIKALINSHKTLLESRVQTINEVKILISNIKII